MDKGAAKNTDRELFREDLHDPMDPDNAYAARVFVTEGGLIGMAVGGMVFVLPILVWHELAQERLGKMKLAQNGVRFEPGSNSDVPGIKMEPK